MQDRKVLAEPLAELETDCADPRDQDINDLTLAAQGEDRNVPRVVVNYQQKVALAALSTDAGWAPHVHVESLQGNSRRGKRGGVRSGALPPLDAREAGRGGRGRLGRKRPGEARDKKMRVHATKARQGGVTQTVVPEKSLVRQEATRARGGYLNLLGHMSRRSYLRRLGSETVEERATTGPSEGSASVIGTGAGRGVRVVLSRKKQREAPESNVKVCKASAGARGETRSLSNAAAADAGHPQNQHAEWQSHRYQSHRLHCRHSHRCLHHRHQSPHSRQQSHRRHHLHSCPHHHSRCHLHHRRCHFHHPDHPCRCCCGASH
ncbi:unnamed protein product [Closterium sp. NIES-53]